MSAFSLLRRINRRGTFLLAFGTASVVTGGGTYWCLTRHQKFYPFDDKVDPLAQNHFVREFNPHSNQSLSDIYQARLPLSDVRPDLLDDHRRGGSRLVERYCSGLLSGWGFAIQRHLSSRKAKQAGRPNTGDIYTKVQIRESLFQPGTRISEHFEVIEKTPSSVLFRGGSPSNGDGLRDVDVLMQGLIEIDQDEQLATFTLKCVFYTGTIENALPPLPRWLTPFHLLYARALAANGTANCRK